MTDPSRNPFHPSTNLCWPAPKLPYQDTNRYKKDRGYVNPRESDHAQCYYYFKQLSVRVKELEERLARQEERLVSKDYFKRIITKLVDHISKLQSNAKPSSQDRPGRPYHHHHNHEHTKDDYSNQSHYKTDNFEKRRHKYNVQPVLVDSQNIKREPQTDRKAETNFHHSHSFWKWSDHIWKPGIDIKNKIIMLLEDTLNYLKRSKDKSEDDDIKLFVDKFTRDLFRTIDESPKEDIFSKRKPPRRYKQKIRTPVDVAFVNPTRHKWRDSEVSLKYDFLEPEPVKQKSNHRVTEYYRCEFIKTIMNTQKEDRHTLWQNIWQQAEKNKQTKEDKVTIQLPDNDMSSVNVQIEYTIGDLEHLLTGKRT